MDSDTCSGCQSLCNKPLQSFVVSNCSTGFAHQSAIGPELSGDSWSLLHSAATEAAGSLGDDDLLSCAASGLGRLKQVRAPTVGAPGLLCLQHGGCR